MTKLLVLGMLSRQSLSGYDIQNLIQLTDAEKWGGALSGSIYYALKKMNEAGYIEIAAMESTGLRQKAIYSITEKGQAYFEKLICKALKDAAIPYPTKLYSALSFIDMIPKEKARDFLTQQRIELQKEYESLEKGRVTKKEAIGHELSKLTELIFDNMFETIQRQIKFINQLLDFL